MVYSDEYRSESSHSNTAVGSIERLKETGRDKERGQFKSHVEQHGWMARIQDSPGLDWYHGTEHGKDQVDGMT